MPSRRQSAASLTQARQELRFEEAKVARLEETVEDYAEVERERDELRGLVKELREHVEGLSRVEKEGRAWKARSMQQA